MALKTLVTGFITAAAAAAVVGGAAAGVTSIASSGMSAAPAIQPVVFDAPLPATPAPDLATPLVQTLQALASGGSFSGKASYIQGGIGRIESIAADRAYSKAAAEGKFPLTFDIANIDDQGGVAYADVTATSNTGGTATQNIQFVAGPSPTGWQISKGSAMALLSSVG
ncbi:hypothetical protein [Mycolicibacterium fortuitum]|uniref:Low molecular weight antigen CFP2 (Low molecular weight protein antigen 2) (CFP-2) n=3 Tax=Mycolicibacterium fortuitum TaxID=1766 RepID=A0A0N9Y347_MYCFO|nr:hypothetical protein [Mycolicibacterium fortuitum]AIY47082.1 Low molecular weight antigen MTB12 [Mycobacterium sp. VKM Ac-1817D]CRL76987.1 low molecular weight antigen MTB12 [Mycolicibacter nonchromogenicus]ALI27434.1 Low molecular weight antigen MTB12 precursor [Mycolicibacterium fortuitum]AMD55131.1 hypothetical protein ATO49_17000 [Mycolicibacterium fortuitum subsp. fortuitum DSM 46621 = ATCC 6841 = JCM 6387]EJZ15934.1 low molecular weight antigen MTB12 [Mycolicibacterium fortuitum subsp